MWRFLLLLFVSTDARRFAFFKDLHGSWEARRVFGGAKARVLPEACMLLDRAMNARCSCTILNPRWALTAAHCSTPDIAYVRYNAQSEDNADLAPVHLLYSHPEYHVKEEDRGQGMDVVLLHHDVGLVRTRSNMWVNPASRGSRAHIDPIEGMKEYDTKQLMGKEVEVLGFGRSEATSLGAQLRAVSLRVTHCGRERNAWLNCACAMGDAQGVCAGDSGGPVMYKDIQVGITSMGPVECSPNDAVYRGVARMPPGPAVSVFTSLEPYVNLINDTIHNTDRSVRMKVVTDRAECRTVARLLSAVVILAAVL